MPTSYRLHRGPWRRDPRWSECLWPPRRRDACESVGVVHVRRCEPHNATLRIQCFDARIAFFRRELFGDLVESRQRRSGVLPIEVYDAALLESSDTGRSEARSLMGAEAARLQ